MGRTITFTPPPGPVGSRNPLRTEDELLGVAESIRRGGQRAEAELRDTLAQIAGLGVEARRLDPLPMRLARELAAREALRDRIVKALAALEEV